MSQTQDNTVVETITDGHLWQAVCDGVNAVTVKEEAALEFDQDGLRVRVMDTGKVAMIEQTIPASSFEHYDVGGDVVIGINTAKFDDLLDVAPNKTVEFNLNAETRKFHFRSDNVEFELAGIDPGAMDISPVEVPNIRDKHDPTINVDLVTDQWKQGIKVVDLAGSKQGTFVAEDGALSLEGSGDKDVSRVVLSDHDGFEWRTGPPDDRVTNILANNYMDNLITIIDEDVIQFVTGHELPYVVFTDRADGRVQTRILQAPRITS